MRKRIMFYKILIRINKTLSYLTNPACRNDRILFWAENNPF